MPISVVLSQAERQDPIRRDFEEQLVTMLVMEDGYDVHIIPHLVGLEEDDTGMLCLEGLTAHIVALSWLAPESAFEQLRTLEIPGRFGRTRQTSETPGEWKEIEHPRAVYCLDLAKFATIDDAREEIRRINQEQPTQVFSIGIGGVDVSSSVSASEPKPNRSSNSGVDGAIQASQASQAIQAIQADPKETTDRSPTADSPEPGGNAAETQTDWDDDESLDRLVDELDELDI